MQGERMAAMIGYLLERQNKNLQTRIDKIGDKLFSKPRKVFLITGEGSYFDTKPGTCWWFLSTLPKGERELFMKEAGKFVLGWAAGLASPALGMELPSTGKDAMEGVSGSSEIIQEAVDATIWGLAKKTDNAWVIAIRNFVIGGCAAFEKTNDGHNIWLRKFGGAMGQAPEGRMMFNLGIIEKEAGNNKSAGIALTREKAMHGGHGYWMSRYGEIREII